jgi:hypothetical protein
MMSTIVLVQQQQQPFLRSPTYGASVPAPYRRCSEPHSRHELKNSSGEPYSSRTEPKAARCSEAVRTTTSTYDAVFSRGLLLIHLIQILSNSVIHQTWNFFYVHFMVDPLDEESEDPLVTEAEDKAIARALLDASTSPWFVNQMLNRPESSCHCGCA